MLAHKNRFVLVTTKKAVLYPRETRICSSKLSSLTFGSEDYLKEALFRQRERERKEFQMLEAFVYDIGINTHTRSAVTALRKNQRRSQCKANYYLVQPAF